MDLRSIGKYWVEGAIVLLIAGLWGPWMPGSAIAAETAEERNLPQFERVVIDEEPPALPWYKFGGDLTGDGEVEIVVAGRDGPIVMYTRPDWQKTLVLQEGFDAAQGVRGTIADINGNGRQDIVMGGVMWFENPVYDDGEWAGEWRPHRIDRHRAHDTLVADVSGDGRPDVVVRDQGGNGDVVHVYYQREPNTWEKQVIECEPGEGIAVADLDGDGQVEIVINGSWFKRDDAGDWTRHVYTTEWTHPLAKVEVADINGNGRMDIVLAPAEHAGSHYRISWFEAPEGDQTQSWQEHVIVEDVETVVHGLALADFNQNGLLDVAYAEMHQGQSPDEVVVMFNFEAGTRWERQVLDTEGSHDIIATDLTGNGVLDLFGANHGGDHPVVIWKNQLEP